MFVPSGLGMWFALISGMLKLFGHPLALFSVKVELLLREAGLEYEFIEVDFLGDALQRGPLRERAPTGRVPWIEDGALCLAESNAILRYLANQHALTGLYPSDPKRRAAVDAWLDFGLVHVAFPLSQLFVQRWLSKHFSNWPLDIERCVQMEKELTRYLPRLEAHLSNHAWLAGSRRSLADLALLPLIAVAEAVGVPLEGATSSIAQAHVGMPRLANWRKRGRDVACFDAVWDKRLPGGAGRVVVPAGSDPALEPQEVLRFWFGERIRGTPPADDFATAWFGAPDPNRDAVVRDRFSAALRRAAEGGFVDWEESAPSALALVLMLDQFPRHVFREDARAFDFDAEALRVCKQALARGFDRELDWLERAFLYLPLMHSEDPENQERSLKLFDQLRSEALAAFRFLRQAREHRDWIGRFGRFPQRNQALGRASTPAEKVFLEHGIPGAA